MDNTNEFQKIRLQIGEYNFRAGVDFSEVEFMGRLLAKRTLLTADSPHEDNSGIDWAVYLTPHDKIAVYHRTWSKFYGGIENAELKVYDSVDEINEILPSWVLNEVLHALNIDRVEYLEI
jgi:EXLDI family protein